MSAAASAGGVAVGSRPSDAARRTESRPANPLVEKSWREFDGVERSARAQGFESPSPRAKAAARKILSALARAFPRYYAVAPGDERDISIETDAGMGAGRGVLIVCDREDIACYVTMDGENTARHYDYARVDELPDEFIRGAVRDLERAPSLAGGRP